MRFIREAILRWARNREPDFIIGGRENPYLRRHWLLPRNRFFNVYVHEFLRSDDDRALHSHPWLFNVSWLMDGEYREWVPSLRLERGQHDQGVWAPEYDYPCPFERREGAWHFRWGGSPHRIELHSKYEHVPGSSAVAEAREQPVWTLFFTGPRVREWGFFCKQGFVHWKVFTAPADTGSIGRGCD